MAIPEPTPVSFLLPSVNIFTVDCFVSPDSHTVTNFDGCSQFFGFTSRSRLQLTINDCSTNC